MANRPVGAVEAFDLIRFGGPTDVRESDVTVDTTVVQLLNNNPDRVQVIITNNGANPIYWSTQPTLSTTTAHFLGSGQMLVFQVQNDGAYCSKAVYAIAAVAGNAVHISYLFRVRAGE